VYSVQYIPTFNSIRIDVLQLYRTPSNFQSIVLLVLSIVVASHEVYGTSIEDREKRIEGIGYAYCI
jgi:hypothetical protein